MIRVWRISNYADLTGKGGLRVSGRWHSKGRPVIYAAEHPAGAMTELLAHIDPADMPDNFQLIEIEIDMAATVPSVDPPRLTGTWTSKPRMTRAIGDAWLKGASSLALRVPSALVPDAWNVLLNPVHADARHMKIVKVQKALLDARLK